MSHIWDHFDYTNDVDWWRAQGWPLLKVGNVSCQQKLQFLPSLGTGCNRLPPGQVGGGFVLQRRLACYCAMQLT